MPRRCQRRARPATNGGSVFGGKGRRMGVIASGGPSATVGREEPPPNHRQHRPEEQSLLPPRAAMIRASPAPATAVATINNTPLRSTTRKPLRLSFHRSEFWRASGATSSSPLLADGLPGHRGPTSQSSSHAAADPPRGNGPGQRFGVIAPATPPGIARRATRSRISRNDSRHRAPWAWWMSSYGYDTRGSHVPACVRVEERRVWVRPRSAPWRIVGRHYTSAVLSRPNGLSATSSALQFGARMRCPITLCNPKRPSSVCMSLLVRQSLPEPAQDCRWTMRRLW